VPFRLVAIVPGLLVLLLAYPLLRSFVSADAAALASAALALDPMVVYYARFARGYELALFLALVLGWAVRRVLDPATRTRAAWSALVSAGALLPWVHLSTLGFVLALALAALVLALRESRALAWRIAAAFGAAGGVALLLYLPVFDQVLRYFREMKPEPPPLDWFGVPTLLAGGRVAAWIWIVLLPVGAVSIWRAQRASVLLAAAALLGPPRPALATHPRGLDTPGRVTCWSAPPSSPPWLRGRSRDARGPRVARGRAARTRPRRGTAPRPALDRSARPARAAGRQLLEHVPRHARAPGIRRALSGGAALLRDARGRRRGAAHRRAAAALHARGAALSQLRAHPRQGGPRRVDERAAARDPARALREAARARARPGGLHRAAPRPDRRGPAYFRFVFEDAWPRMGEPADETFMLRQETIYPQNLVGADATDGIAAQLRAKYGAAAYKDEHVLVWKLAH
jgi:hypothetical protein